MSLFTSDRERHLWAWTLAVLVAIYSTLGLAPTLAGALRDSDLLTASVGFGMLLVAAAIVTLALKMRLGGVEIGVVLGVTAAYPTVFVRMNAIPEERTHLFEDGLVAVLILAALTERASQGRRVPVPALFAVLATSVVLTQSA